MGHPAWYYGRSLPAKGQYARKQEDMDARVGVGASLAVAAAAYGGISLLHHSVSIIGKRAATPIEDP